MALTGLDIVKINKALNQSVDKVSISDFYTFNKKSTASLEDVLMYLINLLVKAFKENDTNTKRMNKLIHHIGLFTIECFKADKMVDKEFYLKLQIVVDSYNEYQGNKEDIEENMNAYILLLKESSPLDNGVDIKLLQELKEEKDANEKKIKELEDTISTLTKEVNRLTKIVEKKKRDSKSERDRNLKNEQDAVHLDIENKRLVNQINSMRATIGTLKSEVARLKEELEANLKTLKEQQQIIYEHNQEQQRAIKEDEELKKQEQKEDFICEVIANSLLASDLRLSDFKKILSSLNIKFTDEEVRKCFNIVCSKLNIKPLKFSRGSIYYGIDDTPISGQSLNIYTDGMPEISFLVLSNMFISSLPSSQKKDIELLYEYCKKNGINYIINLGNLFDFTVEKTPTVEDIKRFEDMLDNILYKYPTDPSIYNLILGGTMEESILSLGLNPIDLLAANRLDFINLGYINASLILGNKSSSSYILLHRSEYDDKKISLPNPNSSNSPYINLIGGDRNLVNTALNSATIASFSSDSLVRAHHMRVCFDSNKKINNIIFMPLIIDKSIVHTSLIHYTKHKTKKE